LKVQRRIARGAASRAIVPTHAAVRPCSTVHAGFLYGVGPIKPTIAPGAGGEQLADCDAQALERFAVGHALEDRTSGVGRGDRNTGAFVPKRNLARAPAPSRLRTRRPPARGSLILGRRDRRHGLCRLIGVLIEIVARHGAASWSRRTGYALGIRRPSECRARRGSTGR
jgi:hypothetical protein